MGRPSEKCEWYEADCPAKPRSGMYCDDHRRMHAQRLIANVEQVFAEHQRRLAARAELGATHPTFDLDSVNFGDKSRPDTAQPYFLDALAELKRGELR
jgi:hypothetical protein